MRAKTNSTLTCIIAREEATKLRSQLATRFLCGRYKQLAGEAETIETIIQAAFTMPLYTVKEQCTSKR